MLGFYEKGHMIFNKNTVDIKAISKVLMASRKMYRPDTTIIIIIQDSFVSYLPKIYSANGICQEYYSKHSCLYTRLERGSQSIRDLDSAVAKIRFLLLVEDPLLNGDSNISFVFYHIKLLLLRCDF